MVSDKLQNLRRAASISQKELDAHPYPVIITDDIGTVLFKNDLAYRLKLLRINSSFKTLLDDEQYEAFLKASKDRSPTIIKCKSETGVTHAAFIPCGPGRNLISLAVCFVALQNIYDLGKIDLFHETYTLNDLLFKSYIEMCEKYKLEFDPKASELLKYNSLRFTRAAKNMSMFIHTLTKTEGFEKEYTHDLRVVCSKLVEHFSSKIAPLGFRMSISFSDESLPTYIQKNTYVTIFLELCALALRIAEDSKCKIEIYKFDDRIITEYRIKTHCSKLASNTYSMEFKFVKLITDHCKWSFSEMCSFDREATFSFSVPIITKTPPVISTPIPSDEFDKDEMFDISEEIFTYLYFA